MAGSRRTAPPAPITVLAGGVGAARFLRGLCSLPEVGRPTVVVNTADDETFFGLHVSPDVDTVIYTLGGRVARTRGWGVAGDTFQCLNALDRYYRETWFRIGDVDLATHLFRSDRLRKGDSLSQVTAQISRLHGVTVRVLPMSDDPVRTIVELHGEGALPFQNYLVKRRGRGRVRKVRYAGARRARPAPGVLRAIRTADTIIIPPSNPIVSIGPILALPGVREALRHRRSPAVAVSPLVGGRPIKGPLHRMLQGLGHEVSAVGVARLYRGLVDLFVVDSSDAALVPRIEALGMRTLATSTIMRTRSHSRRLAARVLSELQR